MEIHRKSIQSDAHSLGANEGQKVILNIREAHDQDKTVAKSLGFIINGDIENIMTGNLHKSCKDYLQIDYMGTETVSDKFNLIDDFILGRGMNNNKLKNISEEPLLSIVRINGRQEANKRHPDGSHNMINDSSFIPNFARQDNNKNERQDIDDRLNDLEIVTKAAKDQKKQFESIFMSGNESNQIPITNKSQFIMVSNQNLIENSMPKLKNKRKRPTVAKKVTNTVKNKKRFYKGLSYLASVIKDVVIFKKVNTYNEIAAEVCNVILPEKRDVQVI